MGRVERVRSGGKVCRVESGEIVEIMENRGGVVPIGPT